MADVRIKDIAATAVFANTDDYMVLDGVANGTRKIVAASLMEIGLPYTIGNRSAVITTGIKGDLEIPCNCEILGWTLLADQSGSIVIDIWRDTYANYPPTASDTITGTEKPTLSGAVKNQDLSLTSWSILCNKGECLRYNVDSASTVTQVHINLRARRRI